MSATMLASDVRNILEGFEGLDRLETIVRTGTLSEGSVIITDIDVRTLKPYMKISGPGIPEGAIISEVLVSSIQISLPALAAGAAVELAITTYTQISDDFIVKVRDRKVIPFVEEKIGFPLSGEPQAITEFRSRT